MCDDDPATVIAELDKAWGAAASAHDLEAVLAFYAPDATLVWPDAPAAIGADAVRESWTKQFANTPGLGLVFEPDEIVSSADQTLASDFGVVRFSKDDPTSGTVTVIGKYVVVWRNDPDGWKVLYDSYNLNQPS